MVLLMSTLGASAQQAYIDLVPLFDADVFLQSGGTGLADPLDEDGRFLDAGTLPVGFAGGSPVVTQDGRAKFQFASLQQAGLDAALINGQSIGIPEGRYASLDMAMLAAPGSFANPFAEIEFLYADGTKDTSRLGPVAGWFTSPVAFDNTFFRYTDDSQVETIVSIPTDFSPDDYYYLLQEQGNGNAGGSRFIDGTGFALYLIDGFVDVDTATLGVTVGNNFVVSIATEYWDPTVSTTEGYTVLANSMELYEGFEHRALGNLKQYTFDVSPYLAENTGELWILFTDATPSNGWGPYLQNITLFTGSSVTFETTLQVAVDASNAEVHAQFQTDGNDEEKKYLYDNNASGPSNRGHRYADGSGALTYRFDLPDDTTEATLAVDLANNFIVSLAGSSDVVRYHSVAVGSADENNYLIDAGGSNPGDNYRFADGEAYMIYQFDLPDDISTAFAQIHIGNQFVIEGAAGASGAFEVEMDWVVESGEETTDNSNLDYYTINLSKYLLNNPGNIVRLRFSDGVPSNGWGPYLKSIIIVDQEETGNNDFEPVLNAMDLFGEDIHNEYNKGYYTIDLTPALQNNAKKEVFVRFTDASPGDGWGPGVFWMAVYSGELDVQSDRLVFDDLKTTMGDPVAFGAGLLHRRYLLNPAKTLSGISLPEVEGDGDQVYLLAATLNGGDAPVSDWMLHE
jgi:hypothetical protein